MLCRVPRGRFSNSLGIEQRLDTIPNGLRKRRLGRALVYSVRWREILVLLFEVDCLFVLPLVER